MLKLFIMYFILPSDETTPMPAALNGAGGGGPYICLTYIFMVM